MVIYNISYFCSHYQIMPTNVKDFCCLQTIQCESWLRKTYGLNSLKNNCMLYDIKKLFGRRFVLHNNTYKNVCRLKLVFNLLSLDKIKLIKEQTSGMVFWRISRSFTALKRFSLNVLRSANIKYRISKYIHHI